MTTAIGRRVPPQRLITLMNPMMRALLRSPLHVAVDNAMLILHVTGRRTGRRYDIPVGYLSLDGRFLVVTQHRWRANLRGGADIEVTLAGRRRAMHAHLDEDSASVATTLNTLIQKLGWQATQRQTGLRLSELRGPTIDELQDAVRRYDLATITLSAS
jgi:F420H(2)-dependent quinone reductase